MEIEYENEEQPFEDELYDELDDDWIKLIEEEEKEYTSFYRESNDMIKIFFTYVNSFNKIYYIKKEIVPLNEGYLNREILINLLKKNKIHRNINHDIISVLQYNIDLEPENVIKYLKQNEFDKENFLTIRSDFNDIYWKDSVSLFKDLNSLHILFYENNKKKKKQTKKVYIKKKSKTKFNRTVKRT